MSTKFVKLEAAELYTHTHTHTHTHTDKALPSIKQIGTICFAILISVFSFLNPVYAGDCGIPNLDTSTNAGGTDFIGYTRLDGNAGGNESNYGLTTGSGQWAVEFDYGTVWGMANCNSTNGTNLHVGAPTLASSGPYCWCQATGFTASGNSYTSGPQCTTGASPWWVYNIQYSSDVQGCQNGCAYYCGISTLTNSTFRVGLFGSFTTYTVTYSCGSGSGNPPVDNDTYPSGVSVAKKTNTCTAPSGYGFAGWTCNGDDRTWPWFSITANTTCVAQYLPLCTVTYSCGSGSGTPPVDSNSYLCGDQYAEVKQNTCTKPGYWFKGWDCGITSSGNRRDLLWFDDPFYVNTNTTCTAQYGQDSTRNITMTFDGVASSPTSCSPGSTFVPPTPAPRPGYVFTGWKVKSVRAPETCGMTSFDLTAEPTGYGYTRYSRSGYNESNYGFTTGSGQWATSFPYGTIYGTASCNNTPGEYGAYNQTVGMPDTSVSGTNCWCQIIGFTPSGNDYSAGPQCHVAQSSLWLFMGGYYNSVDNCLGGCPGTCEYAEGDYHFNNKSAMHEIAGH